MKCQLCMIEFNESKLQESHAVPCYLFFIEGLTRKERKMYADKYKRHLLCNGCHRHYEKELRDHFIKEAISFSEKFFKSIEDKNE